jgi:hypothetical protein
MGVIVKLMRGDEVVARIPDPAGGFCDAAGDFTELLPTSDPSFPVLGGVSPYDDAEIMPDDMPALITEIDRLILGCRTGVESRGLARLRVLAALCADTTDGRRMFFGD